MKYMLEADEIEKIRDFCHLVQDKLEQNSPETYQSNDLYSKANYILYRVLG